MTWGSAESAGGEITFYMSGVQALLALMEETKSLQLHFAVL